MNLWMNWHRILAGWYVYELDPINAEKPFHWSMFSYIPGYDKLKKVLIDNGYVTYKGSRPKLSKKGQELGAILAMNITDLQIPKPKISISQMILKQGVFGTHKEEPVVIEQQPAIVQQLAPLPPPKVVKTAVVPDINNAKYLDTSELEYY